MNFVSVQTRLLIACDIGIYVVFRLLFTEFQAKFLCASLMLAVKFLNENDIVHGSLMPKKIIFNEKYYPQIVSISFHATQHTVYERAVHGRQQVTYKALTCLIFPAEFYKIHAKYIRILCKFLHHRELFIIKVLLDLARMMDCLYIDGIFQSCSEVIDFSFAQLTEHEGLTVHKYSGEFSGLNCQSQLSTCTSIQLIKVKCQHNHWHECKIVSCSFKIGM